jgi:hypothetical protein
MKYETIIVEVASHVATVTLGGGSSAELPVRLSCR